MTAEPCSDLVAVARVFRALSCPVRVNLLDRLSAGPRSAGELVSASGFKQANVSKHLAVLSAAHLVRRMRHGSRVLYTIADQAVVALVEFARKGVLSEMRKVPPD